MTATCGRGPDFQVPTQCKENASQVSSGRDESPRSITKSLAGGNIALPSRASVSPMVWRADAGAAAALAAAPIPPADSRNENGP